MGGQVPTFVVAGAGRAGTTGLVEGLRRHPDVFMTSPKEPHYLALHGTRPDFRGPGDQESINRTAVTSERDYLGLYEPGSGHRALGEGSVSTLYHHRRAVPELRRLNPEARAVVLLRDPVDRAWSSFHYLRSQGREPEADLLAAVADEARRRREGWHHLWHYTAMSRYADAIATLSDQLRPGHVGVWFHDDLERDYAGTLTEVVAFLGLPAHPHPEAEVARVNVSGTPRHPRLQEVVWRAQGNEAMRWAARHATSWRFREAVRGRLLRRDAVPEEVRRALAPVFAADLARLDAVLPTAARRPDWVPPTTSGRAS